MKKSEVIIPIEGTKANWPRDAAGDPAFESLEQLQVQFSLTQVVVMCNRYLKQQEYQSKASQDYQARQRAKRRDAKAK